jgi:hypothetical protein
MDRTKRAQDIDSAEDFYADLLDVILKRQAENNWSAKQMMWVMTELNLYSQNLYKVLKSDQGYRFEFLPGTNATTFAMPALWFYHSWLNEPVYSRFNGVEITLKSDGS